MGNFIPSSITSAFDGMDKQNTSAEALLDRIHDTCTDNLIGLRVAFNKLDENGDGALGEEEVAKALAAVGFPVDGDLRADLWAILDKDGSGKVNYGEFLRVVRNRDYTHAPVKGGVLTLPEVLTTQEALLRVKVQLDNSFESLKETFKKGDADNSGKLDESELMRLLTAHGFTLSEAMNRRLFTAFDRDGDGGVRFSELVSVLSSDLGAGGGEDGEGGGGEDGALNQRLVVEAGRTRLTSATCKPEDVLKAIHDRMLDGGRRLGELFDKFDKDKNGVLSYPEVGKLLQEYGFRLEDELMTSLLSILDKDLSGTVERNEFIRVLQSQDYSHGQTSNPKILYPELTTEEAILRVRNAVDNNLLQSTKGVFKKQDKDNSGMLDFDEFGRMLQKLDLEAGEPMVRRLFAAFDRDGDGGVRYNEFIRVVSSGRLA